ncbi:Kelch repeat-containing protein [Thalassotalea euphylliae]|uniref:Kelch repeat-containing protein n=1 Tax=Thalassotalea euphylliae TaxID=1655234 RepID=UPI003633FE4A
MKKYNVLATLSLSVSLFANAEALPPLPEPVANNAVTSVSVNGDTYLFSFNGLGKNRDYKAVHNKAFMLKVGEPKWQKIADVPIQQPVTGLTGRLASVATSIKDSAYVFGGYTVAKDHSEVSVPDVYAYNVTSQQYKLLAPMPVPVDDSVALPYQNRYIYLVSGWHNDGNVNLVQVYDVETNTWQQASPFPGKPVFGQAGAIVANQMVVCDGVRVDVHLNKRRSYGAETACYIGTISNTNIARIDWRKLQHPTQDSRYRMAAIGDSQTNSMYFVGGSDNPYNYSGIGYNGIPSEPDAKVWRLNMRTLEWSLYNASEPTMDHRALIKLNNALITLGGMTANQEVSDKVITQFKTDSNLK